MIIHDDVLKKEDFEVIRDYVMSNVFTWQYSPATGYDTTFQDTNETTGETPQMIRHLYNHTKHFARDNLFNEQILIHDYWKTVNFDKIPETVCEGPMVLLRAKANLLQPYPDAPEHHPWHKDAAPDTAPCTSILFYLNDVDGDTYFDLGDEIKRVTPKANRCVVFDSTIDHASSNPTTGPRYVLNMVLSTNFFRV